MVGTDDRDALVIEPIPENLLREPLDFIYADHFRQRTLCNMLDGLVLEPPGPRHRVWVEAALAYLERDLPHHVADEEKDLFPRLRARCRPADGVDGLLGLLADEHHEDEGLAIALVASLRRAAPDKALGRGAGFVSQSALFTGTQRRHLAWENSVVLPLARKRLTRTDLEAMGRAMARRRGLDFPD